MRYQVFNLLINGGARGTCLARICRKCYQGLSKVQKHPDFSGPANLEIAPIMEGQRCHICNEVLIQVSTK